jgi:sulfate adenylyltransferase subunit 1 (EFTu-like GTPase family)
MADMGDIGRSARRYRLAGAPRTGKTSIEERLFGALWLPSREATAAILVVDALRGLDGAGRDALHDIVARRVPHVIVAVNRLDLAGYEYETFKTVRAQVAEAADEAHAGGVAVVPVSARFGDNIVARGDRIDWYPGGTLLEFLQAAADRSAASVAAAGRGHG